MQRVVLIIVIGIIAMGCGSKSQKSDTEMVENTPQNQKQEMEVKSTYQGISIQAESDLQWSDNFIINNSELDARRKKILRFYQNVYIIAKNGEKVTKAESALNDLIKTSKESFAAEEDRMARFEYDDYSSHKKAHEEFMAKLILLSDETQNPQNEKAMDESDIYFIKEFFIDHFSNADVKMGKFLKEVDSY